MAGLAGVAPEAVGLSATRLDRVGAWARRWVDQGKLPGVLTLVARRGEIAYLDCHGKADVARGLALAPDTVFRIYSMTKPLTSLAILQLYEEGRFQLEDPISRFLPMFRRMRVFAGGTPDDFETVPAAREITFRDLLTHTSGLTYGFLEATPVDAIYRNRGLDFQTAEADLPEMMERLARLPLLAQPGSEWNYSVSTDVLGALVEVISGQPFDRYLAERIIEPLGMRDTGFHVAPAAHGRFAANYRRGTDGGLELIDDPATSRYLKPRRLNSGGGGLVSTAGDYLRFCQMMLQKGELEGVRVLGRKTVEFMTLNHLPGDMAAMGQPRFSEMPYTGIGFGLGYSVMIDPARAMIVGSPGEFAWGGAASTAFWVDPAEEMIVILLTQIMPSSTYPIRRELRVLTYQALID